MKRINLDQIDSWLAVLDSGSFHEAGKRLSRSQATVSQHIQRLEAHMGGKLVTRGHNGCTPTPLGKRLAPIARSLIAGESQAVKLGTQSSPRLGACSNIGIYLLPQLLSTYPVRETKPAIRIGTNPEIVEALEAGMLEVGLLEWWTPRPSLTGIQWRREPMVAICPPGHHWAGRSKLTIRDLCREPLIGGEPRTGTGRLLRDMLSDGSSLPAPIMELGSTEAVKRAVAAGLGVSIVLESSSMLEGKHGTLLSFHFEPEIYKDLWLVRSANFDPGAPLYSHLTRCQVPTAKIGKRKQA
jgi:DNA-binding transcriptional LysR family regulator